ncbi:MAG: amidohydrolase [Bacteroidota bacterium]
MLVNIIQANIIWEDKKANLAKYQSIIESNLHENSLYVLPEMFSTGFSMNVEALAENMTGNSVQWMKDFCKKHKINICGSIIIKENNQFFNRFVFCNSNTKITHYDKRHLFRMGEENNHFSSGSIKAIINHQGWRIQPLVCYDLRFPVWARNKFENQTPEYDFLIYVANWPKARRNAWITLLKARAIENQCYVIGVNRVGTDGNGLEYSGDSMVICPLGDVICSATESVEELKSIDISLERLKEFRKTFPVGLDADDFEIA